MKPVPVVFENDEILVVNKPAGLPVQGGAGVSRSLDRELSWKVGRAVHLVHRLDKETCGLLVVAKSAAAAARWARLLSSRAARKEYEAVCFGVPAPDGAEARSGVITADVRKAGRTLSAETAFSVEETFSVPVAGAEGGSVRFSRVRLVLGTGRTHQIRVHLAGAGAPVCGDDRHGNFRLNRLARKELGIRNLLLCARKITFDAGGGKRTVEVELPAYFGAFRAGR